MNTKFRYLLLVVAASRTWLTVIYILIICNVFAQIPYPGQQPGTAEVRLTKSRLILENKSLDLEYAIRNKSINLTSLTNKVTRRKINFNTGALFELTLNNGQIYSSAEFVLKNRPTITTITGNSKALKYADRLNGKIVTLYLTNNRGINVTWKAVLLNGSNYVRQLLTLATNDTLALQKVTLIKIPRLNGVTKQGIVDGSPLVSGNMFFAMEHPMAGVEENGGFIKYFLPRQNPITKSAPLNISSVYGITPTGQLRRGYLYYVERERAAPYHQLLHYNSWYDLSWTDRKLDETNCLDRIQSFADSLIIKRHTPLNAFLFDDGWDNNQTLWQFNNNFPYGFKQMAKLSQKYGASLGVWISPWGGYLEDQQQRLNYGRSQQPAFETNEHGFSLAGPIYYQRFKAVTSRFATNYKVSAFKFDGVGAGNGASGASITYQKDIEALLRLITELRTIKPTLYFSLTVGTWPSASWLNYGDVIWRAGKDTHFAGTGSKRQQWITYRDGEAYKNIVCRAPLYPLNAVMYHGVCIADHGPPALFEISDKDIADEIWSFFATGTSLQELYVNPHKLSATNWDVLASAIKWSKENARVLPDTHWIGGDPEKGDVYGYASWSPGKALFSLRNPSGEVKQFKVTVNKLFELPAAFNKRYKFSQVYGGTNGNTFNYNKDEAVTITMKPYETKIFNAEPY